MFKITEGNYGYYKRIAEVIWRFLFKNSPIEVSSESSPINVLNEWEQKSMPLARKGLKTGLVDSLSMLNDAPKDYCLALNEELLKSGLPALSELMTIVNDVKGKVLKRGKIKDVNEWYIIKEILDKTDSDISPLEREELGKLCYDFEYKKKKDK